MALFEKNLTFAEGGGMTSVLLPYRLSKKGIAVGMGIGAAATLGKEMFAQHNRMKMGPVSYEGGPERMTHNVTSGAVEAIMESTKDPVVRADMLKRMTRTDSSIVGNLEEFGVDQQFMSAFYGMG